MHNRVQLCVCNVHAMYQFYFASNMHIPMFFRETASDEKFLKDYCQRWTLLRFHRKWLLKKHCWLAETGHCHRNWKPITPDILNKCITVAVSFPDINVFSGVCIRAYTNSSQLSFLMCVEFSSYLLLPMSRCNWCSWGELCQLDDEWEYQVVIKRTELRHVLHIGSGFNSYQIFIFKLMW